MPVHATSRFNHRLELEIWHLFFQEPQARSQSQAAEKWSCFVFAEQKITCLALSRLMKACEGQLPFIRCESLMGFGGQLAALSQSIAVRTTLLGSGNRVSRTSEVNEIANTPETQACQFTGPSFVAD